MLNIFYRFNLHALYTVYTFYRHLYAFYHTLCNYSLPILYTFYLHFNTFHTHTHTPHPPPPPHTHCMYSHFTFQLYFFHIHGYFLFMFFLFIHVFCLFMVVVFLYSCFLVSCLTNEGLFIVFLVNLCQFCWSVCCLWIELCVIMCGAKKYIDKYTGDVYTGRWRYWWRHRVDPTEMRSRRIMSGLSDG